MQPPRKNSHDAPDRHSDARQRLAGAPLHRSRARRPIVGAPLHHSPARRPITGETPSARDVSQCAGRASRVRRCPRSGTGMCVVTCRRGEPRRRSRCKFHPAASHNLHEELRPVARRTRCPAMPGVVQRCPALSYVVQPRRSRYEISASVRRADTCAGGVRRAARPRPARVPLTARDVHRLDLHRATDRPHRELQRARFAVPAPHDASAGGKTDRRRARS